MKDKLLNVVVVGFGHLGRWHLQKAVFSECTDKVYLVDSRIEALDAAKMQYPEVTVTTDLDSIISKVDAAIIVTPTSTHSQFLSYFIKHNKHIFCEKPVVSNMKEAADIEKKLEGRDLVLQVGHSERFHEIWENIGPWAPMFEIPSTIKLERQAPFKGRATDVDCVQDLMIHDIDLMLYLFKEMPKDVTSTGYKMRTGKWDYVCSNFSFSSGKRCYITVGRNHVEEVRTLDIANSRGALRVDLFRLQVIWASAKADSEESFVTSTDYPKRDHLAIEQAEFYNSIINQKDPVVTIKDGVNAINIIDKVLESLETNSTIEI